VKVGVRMKHLVIILLFFGHFILTSQTFDSTYIQSSDKVVVKGKQILTYFQPRDSKKPLALMHFDGNNWKQISNDSIPTIGKVNSRLSFSQFSDHIYVTGLNYVWEYDGKDWTKYFIDDSLHGKREFYEIIELPDTSFIVTAFSQIVKYTTGNIVILDKTYHEVLQFKSGKFTTIKSRWTDKNTKVGGFHSFQKLKVQPNGNYSYYTPIETPIPDRIFELVTFSPTHQIVKKDTNPDLSSYGFHLQEVNLFDYLYDAKGSLWFTISYSQRNVFACLVEKKSNGELFLYGENIGLPTTWISSLRSFDLDEYDNIWFNHIHGVEFVGGNGKIYHSMYMLNSDRTTLKEYKYDEFMNKSIWFTGGNNTLDFLDTDPFRLIKYRKNENSLLICSDRPMLLFFPDKETTVNEITITPIHLYPNPVQLGNNVTIESGSFEKASTPLSVVIRDVSGTIFSETIVSSIGSQLQITTQDLATGTYFVSVLSNNKTILQTKFIKE